MRFALILLCFLPFLAQAQRRTLISSDRPGQGQTPLVVGKNYFQMQLGLENGLLVGQERSGGRQAKGDALHSSFFLRYGLSARTELHVGATIDRFRRISYFPEPPEISIWPVNPLYPASYRGMVNNLQFGFRHTLMTEGAKHDFSLGLIGSYVHNASPLHSRYRDGNGLQLGLLASKKVSKNIRALGNIGINWGDPGAAPDLYYVVNFAFDLGKNIGLFVETKQEVFFSKPGDSFTLLDGGLTWLLAPNFQLDLYGGWSQFLTTNLLQGNFFGPLALRESYGFVALGLSWRIKALPSKPKIDV
ncbi:MAG: hypothetical protein ACK417_02650 [Bacteroidia bacterium]